MRERPILFSAPMVTAILEGRKTQTRRVVRFPSGDQGPSNHNPWLAGGTDWQDGDEPLTCPYGRPGDRLWVRETWGMSFLEHVPEGRPATPGGTWGVPAYPHWNPCVVYRADGEMPQGPDGMEVARWAPPIHMPRWASRLTLEVVSVRVERLQAITEEDARAEGITDGGCLNCGEPEPCKCAFPTPDARDSFIHLWDSINAKRAPWSSNPWVWVVEFRRIET